MRKSNTRSAQGSGTIRKKTVTRNGQPYTYWEARVTVGNDPGTGKQIQKSFSGKTQKEVREKMTAALHEIDKGTYVLPSKLTVAEWMKEWMDTYCRNTVKPLTISAYNTSIKTHINPAIGNMPLQSVRGVQIQKLYNAMLEGGSSAKTIKNTSAIMHKAFAVAVKQGIIPQNPCDAAELPKAQKHEISPLSDAQIPLFLEAIENDRYRNAFALCLFAGLREGECLGLSWKQVDFENGKITINQQLQIDRLQGNKYVISNSTKSGKVRVIEPPPIAFAYLKAEKAKQARNRLKAGALWQNEFDLVFTEESGRYIIFLTFHHHFKNIAASIGCPAARPHDLRHTAATVAIASGADVKSVQALMGHATASFTLDVYAHASDKMRTETAQRMQGYYDSLKKA